jgi:crossover junction endodeoxyribonuclease RuvC
MRIGIDPGVSGAIAILDSESVTTFDMPTMTSGKKQMVNAAELAKLLESYRRQREGGVCIYLEQVSAMPGQGVSSMFNFGVSFGIVQGITGALQIPMILVTPQSWKKRAGLLKKDKDAARTLAQQLYPAAPLGRKKDIGRADAILIARFGE